MLPSVLSPHTLNVGFSFWIPVPTPLSLRMSQPHLSVPPFPVPFSQPLVLWGCLQWYMVICVLQGHSGWEVTGTDGVGQEKGNTGGMFLGFPSSESSDTPGCSPLFLFLLLRGGASSDWGIVRPTRGMLSLAPPFFLLSMYLPTVRISPGSAPLGAGSPSYPNPQSQHEGWSNVTCDWMSKSA